jgi:carbonic anhydrase
MDTIETLIDRNADFAEHRFSPGLRIVPHLKTLLVGCLDPRVDPAQVLGVELGEVGVIRNIGGRVTPDVLAEIALLVTLTKTLGGALGPGWDLIVLQHTDCGILRMQGEQDLLGDFLGVTAESLGEKMVGDPRKAVEVDVAALRADPNLPSGMRSSGYVYDVATGLIENVVPAAP